MDTHKTRIKIFLVKEGETEFVDLFKEKSFLKYQSKIIGDITLYYKQYNGKAPRWYRKFLMQGDTVVHTAGVSAFFVKNVVIDQKVTRFVITFGGGEQVLNLEKFEDKFGLKVALNLASSFASISKNNISTTMSKTREQATKGMNVSEFGIDFEKDMLQEAVVIPKENELTKGNINGGTGLSFVTETSLDGIEDVLKYCYSISREKGYQKDYPFIDNIEEIKHDKHLIERINEEIFKQYKAENYDKVWFSLPELIELDNVNGFVYSKGKKTGECFEIAVDSLNKFLDEEKIVIAEFKDFKKIFIDILSDDNHYVDTRWKLIEALYASVMIDDKHYVLNGKRYFCVDDDYIKSVENRFSKIAISNLTLPANTKTQGEGAYLDEVCQNEPNYVLLDKKLVTIQTNIEVCDIFDKKNHTFIHVKKYGSSSVLSHLFAQAFVSAGLFANEGNTRAKVISKITEEDKYKDYDKFDDKRIYTVVMAIMTNQTLPTGTHVNLPFFSKLNLVSTVEKISALGFKSVEMAYIYSSAPLWNKGS